MGLLSKFSSEYCRRTPGAWRQAGFQGFSHQSSLKYFLTNKESVAIALAPGAGPEMYTK